MSQNKSIRLKTEPGKSKNIQLKIDQDFDFLEVLSLKISQEDLYTTFCSNYGVVVGRVIANKGFGIPNAKVSVFVPISSEDEQNQLIIDLYPFKTPVSKNGNLRYNLLLSEATCSLNRPVGSFPTKEEVIDNDIVIEIFEKYYKYTTSTNSAGDYMIFGVPTGQQVVHMDVDLSDIGLASIKPYDMVRSGFSEDLFDGLLDFKVSENLDELAQIKSGNRGVEVIPFWGDQETCEIGITRVDFDINQKIELTSLFTGAVFTDIGKDSINKSCNPREDQGENGNLKTGKGGIKVIRVEEINNVEWFDNGELEPLSLEDYTASDAKIDENGTFLMVLPMNIGYMVTSEDGGLVPSPDNETGIATKGMYRFAMSLSESKTGRFRKTATAIFPSLGSKFGGTEGRVNGKPYVGTEDQKFTNNIFDYAPKSNKNLDSTNVRDTINKDFHTFEWKQVYTISQYIKKYKKGNKRFSFLGLKKTDDGHNNPLPFTNAIYKPNFSFIITKLFVKLQITMIKLALSLVLAQIGFCFCIRLKVLGVGIDTCLELCLRPFGFMKAAFFGRLKNDKDFDEDLGSAELAKCTADDQDGPFGCNCGTCDSAYGLVLECGSTKYCINVTSIINEEKKIKCEPLEKNGIKIKGCPKCKEDDDIPDQTGGDQEELSPTTKWNIKDIKQWTTPSLVHKGYLIQVGCGFGAPKCPQQTDVGTIVRFDGVLGLQGQYTIDSVGDKLVGITSTSYNSSDNCVSKRTCDATMTAYEPTENTVEGSELIECKQTPKDIVDCWGCCLITDSAEKNSTWSRVFFDSWLTGSAYMFQYKYKENRKGKESFCGPGGDNENGDGYKNQDCCYGRKSSVSNPCNNCLIRGPYVTNKGLSPYHMEYHNNTVPTIINGDGEEVINSNFYSPARDVYLYGMKLESIPANPQISNGASDLGEHIYCNSMYSTKIVNLGPIDMCEDILNAINVCLDDNGCNMEEYNVKEDYYVGSGYESGFDTTPRVIDLPSTSYQNPLEYLQNALTKQTLLGKGTCSVGTMFRPGGDGASKHTPVKLITGVTQRGGGTNGAKCFEYEAEDYLSISTNSFYNELTSLSKIHTDFSDGIFVHVQDLGQRFEPCDKDDNSCNDPWLGPGDTQYRSDFGYNILRNIPYFYFGLRPGATAMDRLKNDYFKF